MLHRLLLLPTICIVLLATNATSQNANPEANLATNRTPGAGKFVKMTPQSLDFGSEKVDGQTQAASQVVTVTNSGPASITLSDIVTTGIDFSQTNNCGQSLAAGATCTVTVNFKPAIQGQRMATLQIDDSDPLSPQTIVLTGTGQ